MTSTMIFNWLWPCGLLPGPALILDQLWHHFWCSLLPESKLLELPVLLCKLMKWAFFPQSEIPMEFPICLYLGKDDQAQISRGSWRSFILTGCSACTASAPLPQEMATTAQRLFLKAHFCALESVVTQPLAFINELSELVNFILNEACQVNPPASVTLTNNSTFPLFPWLIISKKWHNMLKA